MSEIPSYDLELKAANERRRLHELLGQLKSEVHDKLDVRRTAREHLGLASGLAAVVGLGAGYLVTSIFVGR